MEDNIKDTKRKKDKHDDDEYRKEKQAKRARSRSRSPAETREDSRRKRKHSKSPSRPVKHEKQNDTAKESGKTERPERKNKDIDMLNTRTGGAYIPPARLRLMQAQITDKSSVAFQRLAWEALKKSIHGHINKINVGNIGIIIKELLKENIVRGRGLLCRSVIQAQAASPTFTNVYAALVAAVNSRFPNIGELLLKRLVIQFKRGFKRNDKAICISSASFIAHLVNQRVAHEILALELLTLLVESPTDDSVEVAIAFLKECGQKLTEVSSKGVNAIFEMLRNILHEGQLDKRVQYMIEVMFQVWKDGFKDHPALIEELELVPEEEQFTHLLMLDDATDPQDILNVFKFDDKFEENEQKYKTLCKEILGSDAEDDEEGSGESGSEGSDEEEDDDDTEQKPMTIIDNTETNLVALRRTIYLTINSSLDFEECAHKLMKMQLKPGQEIELCHMFLDCCAEQRTYEKFYGLLAQRFCNINRIYIEPFQTIFKDSYLTAHRLDTNRLRNVSKFFAHLLFTDSIGWEVLECVKLNEEDTTSSSRIYIKILFQELAEYMGLKKLNDRLKDPTLQEAFSGIFPRDNPKNTRFSINFFTSIGLGGLTDELREHLKQMPKNVPPPITEINLASESDSSSSSSSSSDSSDSDSSSESDQEANKEKRKKKDKTKDKSKDKSPKTPDVSNKETERWGHDGFYDTYGKDARRHERPDTGTVVRDSDGFMIPRDVRRRDDQRTSGSRRDERRRDDEYRNRDDDRRREDRHEDKDKRYDNRNESRERTDERIDSRSRENEDSRRRKDVRDDSRSDYDDQKDSRKGRDDKRGRNDREDSRKGLDNKEESKRNRDEKEDYRSGRYNKEDSRRDEDDSRRRSDDDTRRRSEDDKYERRRREEDKESSRNIRDGDDRNRRRDDVRREDSRDSKSRRKDERTRDDDSRSEREEKRSRSDYKSREEDSEDRDDDYRKSKNKKKKDKRTDTDSQDESGSDDDKRKSKKKDKSKKNNSDSSDNERSRKKRKHKNKKKDEDEGWDILKASSRFEILNGKENKRDKHDKKKDKERSKRDDSDSSDDSSRKKRKDKKKGKGDEGWDIMRASSLRKETLSRYWNNDDR